MWFLQMAQLSTTISEGSNGRGTTRNANFVETNPTTERKRKPCFTFYVHEYTHTHTEQWAFHHHKVNCQSITQNSQTYPMPIEPLHSTGNTDRRVLIRTESARQENSTLPSSLRISSYHESLELPPLPFPRPLYQLKTKKDTEQRC